MELLHSLRLMPRPNYSLEERQEAWRAWVRSPSGRVILDLLVHQAFMVQPEDVRGLGKQDLMLWMLKNIQEAEEHYGRGTSTGDEQPPGGPDWRIPQPGR